MATADLEGMCAFVQNEQLVDDEKMSLQLSRCNNNVSRSVLLHISASVLLIMNIKMDVYWPCGLIKNIEFCFSECIRHLEL